MSSLGRIKRRNTDQTMNPLFRFQESIGKASANHIFSRFDTRFIPWEHVQFFNLKSFGFCPLDIHADEHFCPVLRFRTTGSGMECNNGIVGIIFSTEK